MRNEPWQTTLRTIWEDWKVCSACPEIAVEAGRKVFGRRDGTRDARVAVLFVGVSPGEVETMRHRAFVGPSGNVLDATIAKAEEVVGWSPSKYFLNLVMCRAHDGKKNRDPKPAETRNCRPRLLAQMRVLKPRSIIRLGRFVTQELEPLPEGIPVFDCWHPSFVVRERSRRAAYEEQMRFVFSKLKEILSNGA